MDQNIQQTRRGFLKKAAYAAPVIMALGSLTSASAAAGGNGNGNAGNGNNAGGNGNGNAYGLQNQGSNFRIRTTTGQ